MASEFIGAIVGAVSGTVYAVINPDEDAELDNPRLLLLQAHPETLPPYDEEKDEQPPPIPGEREPMAMVRIPRGDYMAALTMQDVADIIARLTQR